MQTLQTRIDTACQRAINTIAPNWPLDKTVGVNPHWKRIQRPVREVAARLALLGRFQVYPRHAYLRRQYDKGRISQADLAFAIKDLNYDVSIDDCLQGVQSVPQLPYLSLFSDLLDDHDSHPNRLTWREQITWQISQTCASYFDNWQGHWLPDTRQGLYAYWHRSLTHDHGIRIATGLHHIGAALSDLPGERSEVEAWALQHLGLPEETWSDYLEALLLSINGWASWCAYLDWQARGHGHTDMHIRELLAVRLAFEAVLIQASSKSDYEDALTRLQNKWRHIDDKVTRTAKLLEIAEVWQLALETGYQKPLADKLISVPNDPPSAPKPKVQAVFCIDTRSELMRRALEAHCPYMQTRAFAGFFGIPVTYSPFATPITRLQMPGLGFADYAIKEHHQPQGTQIDPHRDRELGVRRHLAFATADQAIATTRWPSTTFSFVEAAGFGYLGKIMRWIKPAHKARMSDDRRGLEQSHSDNIRPLLADMTLTDKVSLATHVLTNMGLAKTIAPLVILIGHASHTTNNAHASTLDCGACAGQSGEANARALAALLNEVDVRKGVSQHGIDIPQDTTFMAGLHNTTTDEISGFDIDLLPPKAAHEWQVLQPVFAQAADQVRRERAPRLWMRQDLTPANMLRQFRERANDGAQTRPEWGLTGNAAFLIGPRWRTRNLKLPRTYLHDYEPQEDPSGKVLDDLLMGPTLVCHWLSWQYHASTCDPLHYGAGNKVLHNVVGGHIGVFEGNGGDLRIGLPKQSLHDGEDWCHEPLRLTTIIDAPAPRIEASIAAHQELKQILDNDWMILWRYQGSQLQRYVKGQWLALKFD